MRVVAPVPYYPPIVPGPGEFRRFRQVPYREVADNIEVRHPRFITGPGYSTHNLDAQAYLWGVSQTVDRMWRERPFDLIHAHFIYPDGVVGARLAQRYGVPLVVTEHAFWHPWLDQYPVVRKQAMNAAQLTSIHIAVSQSVRRSVSRFTGEHDRLRVLPVGVDMEQFSPLSVDQKPDDNSILFVGRIHETKGVDTLLQAMQLLIERNPAAQLSLIGGSFYRQTQLREERLIRLAEELGLAKHVRFLGIQPPAKVAEAMRRATLFVLPSRRETLGSVLIEALACGTPVVATRCGGPEDVVTDAVGTLVPTEDPASLADAMATMLAHRQDYDSQYLRRYAAEKFSWQRVAAQTIELYRSALEKPNGFHPEK
ncbi:MAG: glycosyltransferase [Anaerolineales bacterium]|nr:glycosyltransferase [Anaerolineales bacterium]